MTSQITTLGNDDRISFDLIYMNLAAMLSDRSTCARLKVGCVIVSEDNQRVLAIGYNGSYKGGPNACDSAEPGLCGCVHAEQNAIIKMDYNDHCRKKLYTLISPCSTCAKFIVNAGISEVIYGKEYRTTKGLEILQLAKIPYRKLDLEERDVPFIEDSDVTEV